MNTYGLKPKSLPQKDIQRKNIIFHLDKSGRYSGNVLTLPAGRYLLEKRISSTLPHTNFKYTMVERDKDVYLKLIKNSVNYFNIPPSYHLGSMADMIYRAKENYYSHCFLDYCCTVNSVLDEIKYALENRIVKKNGLITFTFALRNNSTTFWDFVKEMLGYQRLPKPNKIKKGYSKSQLDSKSSISERAIKAFFNRYSNDWGIISTNVYKDNKQAPMILVIIKRK